MIAKPATRCSPASSLSLTVAQVPAESLRKESTLNYQEARHTGNGGSPDLPEMLYEGAQGEANEPWSASANATAASTLQDLQAATNVLYWNAPLPQFEKAPHVNVSSSGGSIESGGVTVTGTVLNHRSASLLHLPDSCNAELQPVPLTGWCCTASSKHALPQLLSVCLMSVNSEGMRLWEA